MNHSQGSLQWGKQVSAQRFDSPFLATDCQLQRSAERSFRPTIIQKLSNDYPTGLSTHTAVCAFIKGLNAFDRKVIQGDLGRGATPHKNRIWLVHGPRSRVTGSCMASPWPTPPSRIHTDTGGGGYQVWSLSSRAFFAGGIDVKEICTCFALGALEVSLVRMARPGSPSAERSALIFASP